MTQLKEIVALEKNLIEQTSYKYNPSYNCRCSVRNVEISNLRFYTKCANEQAKNYNQHRSCQEDMLAMIFK